MSIGHVIKAEGSVSSGGASMWKTWTPTITNLTLGNGTVTARYIELLGVLVVCRFMLVVGSTTTVATPVISLPVSAASNLGETQTNTLGWGGLYDTSAAGRRLAVVRMSSASEVAINLIAADVTDATIRALTTTVPWTWATGDEIKGQWMYEPA